MVTAVLSQGTELYFLDDSTSPAVIRRVTQALTIDAFGPARATVDGTSFDSSAKEKIPGLVDNGSPSFDVIFNPQDVGHQTLSTLASAPAYWRFLISRRLTCHLKQSRQLPRNSPR
jgi:hypothetical protein